VTQTSAAEVAELRALAHRCHYALETIHVVGYFSPENAQAYEALGLNGVLAYFPARSAPMGPVPAEVVTATFFNFAPALVALAMDGVWDRLTPGQVLDARHAGIQATLARMVGEPDVGELVDLLRTGCAALPVQGRPLYAGHAALPWPDEPVLALWHASALLREHRGDGHIAVLLAHGLDPVEAIVLHGQHANVTKFMRNTRGWAPEQWTAGCDRLHERGLIGADGTLTADGRALKERMEEETLDLHVAAYEALGLDGTRRVLELVRPLRDAVRTAGGVPGGIVSTTPANT
jgi:hypothetical protein